jgi:hypothetical protein
MKTVNYTAALRTQLDLVRQTSNEVCREDANKTAEQLLAEIEFLKNLLDGAAQLIS